MWKWSLLALGLGLLFAVLAWSGLRRRSSWRDGEKLWGQVAGVSVTPVWNGADSMDGDRSPARVTLRLSLEGREVSLQKDFPKVLAAPALGQLLGRKNLYFVPFRQDDCQGKPFSLVADLTLLPEAAYLALAGQQMQPILR